MIATRLANPADTAALAELFYRIDLHYFGPKRANREAALRYVARNLFQPHCGVQVMLAERDGQAIGLATFSLLYPAPEYSGQLYMKDLFTLEEARGSGAGKALLRALAQTAVHHGCLRLDWTAERGNQAAVDFYHHIGARIVEDKIYYRIDGEVLRAFAEASL
ncbi:GNAT family N-acetyltransferase [Chromobacterium sinusclupearum]|uniref:GNAT family N-acetyltransferase n=1 Tax=Chromobacterium sinusclupearum TaxID=2077146 RepID=A0A2K4ML77_9NEIS|nr:GNAT family N-acetyltransferase [Chromobacterium sinusclupearum]POA97808.1 GNAT family N-acetyltransferase [Chromobacterium sinusclupearum]